jgi:branched-chain amino acid transport system ATP-binding protein
MSILLVEQRAHAALSIAQRGYALQTGRIVLEDEGERLLGNEEVKRAYLGI